MCPGQALWLWGWAGTSRMHEIPARKRHCFITRFAIEVSIAKVSQADFVVYRSIWENKVWRILSLHFRSLWVGHVSRIREDQVLREIIPSTSTLNSCGGEGAGSGGGQGRGCGWDGGSGQGQVKGKGEWKLKGRGWRLVQERSASSYHLLLHVFVRIPTIVWLFCATLCLEMSSDCQQLPIVLTEIPCQVSSISRILWHFHKQPWL